VQWQKGSGLRGGMNREAALERSRKGPATVRLRHLPDGAFKACEAFWTTSKYGLRLVGPMDMSFIAGG
jgi:hypothetical protein